MIDPGHEYELDQLDGSDLVKQRLVFVKRFRGSANHPGVTCQEVLRALIHRTVLLDQEKPHRGNAEILAHLRQALVLYEARALERKAEKGEILPESIAVDPRDGHIKLEVA